MNDLRVLVYGGWLLFLILAPIVIQTWKDKGPEKALAIVDGTIAALWIIPLVILGKHLIWWLSE